MDREAHSPEWGLLGLRMEVLRGGLRRFRDGEAEGAGTVRRMARVLRLWGQDEGIPEIEGRGFRLEVCPEMEVPENGEALLALLDELLATEDGPGEVPGHLILAVEDEPAEATLLESALQAPGRAVEIVSTVAEAQEALAAGNVSLLILDLALPDEDGRGLLIQAREVDRNRNLPILVLSGNVRPETKSECLALGANAFFEKPLDAPQLAAAVASYLRRESERRAEEETDPLTGLLDRVHFRSLWAKRSFPEPTSVGLVGLDRFRTIRDRFGEGVSDAVVGAVASLLKEILPRTCVCVRWGVSEFLILAPGLDRTGTGALLNHVLKRLRNTGHADSRGETFRVTASGGVVELKPGDPMDLVILEAERRLAWAAGTGGNTLAEDAKPEEPATVLLAEDDPLSAGILQHRLESEGFKVLHYPDGALALEGAMAHQVSMAILDVKMPVMDGFELLGRLRKVPMYQDLPIMMLTSMGSEEDIVQGFRLGADDYMLKPFSPVEVVARARRLLRR